MQSISVWLSGPPTSGIWPVPHEPEVILVNSTPESGAAVLTRAVAAVPEHIKTAAFPMIALAVESLEKSGGVPPEEWQPLKPHFAMSGVWL
jgi:hypothetical protein